MANGIHKTTAKVNEKEFKFEVIEKCGIFGSRGKATLELRYVSWNGAEPKYDIRPWYTDDEGNEACYKGYTLSGEELETLGNLLAEMMGITKAKKTK